MNEIDTLVLEFEKFFKDLIVSKIEIFLTDECDDDNWCTIILNIVYNIKGYTFTWSYDVNSTLFERNQIKIECVDFFYNTPNWICHQTFVREFDELSDEFISVELTPPSIRFSNVIDLITNDRSIRQEFFNVIYTNHVYESFIQKLRTSYKSYIESDECTEILKVQKERERNYFVSKIHEVTKVAFSRGISFEEIIEIVREEALKEMIEK